MTFKEFVKWCNDRTCDGYWSMNDAIACMQIMKEVNEVWFSWRKENFWQKNYSEAVETQIVNPINQKIKILLK